MFKHLAIMLCAISLNAFAQQADSLIVDEAIQPEIFGTIEADSLLVEEIDTSILASDTIYTEAIAVDEEMFIRSVGTAPHFISLHGGISLPADQFGATELQGQSGFAQTGIQLGLSGAYFLTRNFGIGGTLTFSSNKVNEEALAEAFNEAYIQNLSLTPSTNTWQTMALHTGVYLSLPEGNITFDTRFLIGLSFTNAHNISLSANGNEVYLKELSSKMHPSINVGLGFQYPITQRLGITAFADYTVTTASFDGTERIQLENLSISSFDDSNYGLSRFNISLGLSWYFNNNFVKEPQSN